MGDFNEFKKQHLEDEETTKSNTKLAEIKESAEILEETVNTIAEKVETINDKVDTNSKVLNKLLSVSENIKTINNKIKDMFHEVNSIRTEIVERSRSFDKNIDKVEDKLIKQYNELRVKLSKALQPFYITIVITFFINIVGVAYVYKTTTEMTTDNELIKTHVVNNANNIEKIVGVINGNR